MEDKSTEDIKQQFQRPVGVLLKDTRLDHKTSNIDVIAEELCIRPHLLRALEEGDFDSFPSACYATGFLKNYAAFLGLDTKEVITRYEAEYAGSKQTVVLTFPEVEKRSYFSFKRLMGVSSICAAMISGVWATSTLDAEEADAYKPVQVAVTQESDVVQEQTPVLEVEKLAQVAPASGSNEKIVTSSNSGIKLQALDDVWVRISDEGGTTLVERILSKGEDFVPPAQDNLKLMTNNAAALSIMVGAERLESLGGSGEIIHEMVLHSEKLLDMAMLR